MRTKFLLGTAAVGVLITGAIAQTTSGIERIKDAAGYSKSLSTSGEAHKGGGASQTSQNAAPPQQSAQPKKNVRTVYPNTQNAEQAIRESKSARGKADASKPGDVTPLPNPQQPNNEATTQASPPAQAPQQNAQAPSTHESTPPSGTQQSPPAPATQTTQTTPVPAQPATQPAQPSSTLPSSKQSAPTATAQQQTPPSEAQAAQPAQQGSSGVVALDTQQQTSIGQVMARHNVKPLTNVTFSMAVGTKVPTAVQLRALPSDVATFVPQYRGYSYVSVEEQIVIVDPATQAIVAIVPYTAAPSATRTAEPAPATRAVETHTAKSRETRTVKSRKSVAQKPMVSRSVNLDTEEKSETRHPLAEQRETRHPVTEQRKTTRSVSKREPREREAAAPRDYREPERAPRTVTVEQFAEPAYRELPPRRRGFFGLFGGGNEDDDY